MIIMNYY